MPRMFQVHVSLSAADGAQEYTWFYDADGDRERMDWSESPYGAMSSLFLYHARKWEGCEDTNTCATIANWGPGQPCARINTSNTLEVFWGWLRRDEFTNQSATFLGHDRGEDCDLWQHNSYPEYPELSNQTACVRMAAGGAVPVYMEWVNRKPREVERKRFSHFKAVQAFPPGTWEPPQPCPYEK